MVAIARRSSSRRTPARAGQTRVSAFERMRQLPPVFSLQDLCRIHGMDVDGAKVWVKRMRKRSMVRFAGPRTSYYYNIALYPDAPRDHLLDVVASMYPDAVVVGARVLNAYQWITQIPNDYDIAVAPRRSYAAIDGVVLHVRPRTWYRAQQAAGAILREGESPFQIDSLTPAAALKDIHDHPDGRMWTPDPDDLYIPDDVEEGVTRLAGESTASE